MNVLAPSRAKGVLGQRYGPPGSSRTRTHGPLVLLVPSPTNYSTVPVNLKHSFVYDRRATHTFSDLDIVAYVCVLLAQLTDASPSATTVPETERL